MNGVDKTPLHYSCRCHICGEMIPKGSRAFYSWGLGIVHYPQDCRPPKAQADAPNTPAPDSAPNKNA